MRRKISRERLSSAASPSARMSLRSPFHAGAQISKRAGADGKSPLYRRLSRSLTRPFRLRRARNVECDLRRERRDELRPVTLERGIAKHAEGSCLVRFGDTHVLCTASLADQVPSWLRGGGKGWVTAEYGMLPRATHERMRREATRRAPGRAHAGDPAPDRPLAPRRRRSEGARRAADHGRLRRAAGGRRHAHRRDHRRVGGAARRARLDAGAQHDRRERARRPRRRDLLRHRRRRRRCSTSTTPRIPPPAPTRISS